MNKEMKREVIGSLIWAGIMICLALGATFARQQGYVDRDTVIRIVTAPTGLWMAWYGNRMPKTMVPTPATARQARRVASWSLVLSGLVYVGLWAFAPMPVAIWGGTGVVLAGVVVTLGYCLSLWAKAKAV